MVAPTGRGRICLFVVCVFRNLAPKAERAEPGWRL